MRDGLRQRGPVLPLGGGVSTRLTHRTARVLEGVARHPGASNRVVGECAGISDKGQVSKLLARLQRLGLIENAGQGHHTGQPNAWTLTGNGAAVERALSEGSGETSETSLVS